MNFIQKTSKKLHTNNLHKTSYPKRPKKQSQFASYTPFRNMEKSNYFL